MTRPRPPSRSVPSRTLKDFLLQLDLDNKTIAAWAQEQGFALSDVYAVTGQRTVGRRGTARRIVIAMGLQPPPMHRAAAVHLSSAGPRPGRSLRRAGVPA